MDVIQVEPMALIGNIRRFGSLGPIYQVTGIGKPDHDGYPQMSILVVESGETLDYPVCDIVEDPIAD
jgi:hypothetical protein